MGGEIVQMRRSNPSYDLTIQVSVVAALGLD